MSQAGPAQQILALARGLGFDDAGVAPPALPEEEPHFRQWLSSGFAGGMAWIEGTVDVRLDLRLRFPWARSVVVVVSPYGPEVSWPGQGLLPYVSCYARGQDYHELLLPRLQALATRAEEQLGSFRHHAYVDTGPAMERQLARAAGLGWLGKNGLLLRRRGRGSWCFLGVLVTDLELPWGHPELSTGVAPGDCGACRACQPACPTSAFVEPGVLDSRRCISYLTIEHRGPIDRELRRAMGAWLFGCDLCQSSCPFNHPIPEGEILGASSVLGELELEALLHLDEEEFRRRFRHTPLWRPRREGLLRNALMVAANLGRRECLPAARCLLVDSSAVLREAASWCMAELEDDEGVQRLQRAASDESEEWVKKALLDDAARLASALSSRGALRG